MFKRGGGVLLHISSLPSPFGIGDFGPSAYRFVDFLVKARQSYWQILPLNPTDPIYGNSPYNSVSAFASNILFISPHGLVQDGFLDKEDIKETPQFDKKKVEYISVIDWKDKIFDLAYQRFQSQKKLIKEFDEFSSKSQAWLDDYCLFICLKENFQGQQWNKWPAPLRDRDAGKIEGYREEFKEKMNKYKFLQFVFFRQWQSLKEYANQKGVGIVGDIPIYVNYDSVDVWSHPQNFRLDENKHPVTVAGVPPDYFSETGQRWGNPVYDWDKIKEDDYAWWLNRLKRNLEIFNYIRIDHFRGFVACWEIPQEEETAINGKWTKAPADDFFNACKKIYPEIPVIAEDLGIITPDVTAIMEKYGFPGMKVLMFAFGGDIKKHPYIPENCKPNCIVYTGTHDNNTVVGWVKNDITEEEKKNLTEYLKKEINVETLAWDLIAIAYKSVAQVAIVPMQDILGLDENARMNKPATTHNNWLWRLSFDDLTSGIIKKLARLVSSTERK